MNTNQPQSAKYLIDEIKRDMNKYTKRKLESASGKTPSNVQN